MEDENSITEEEINIALRAAVMDMAIIPMIAGSSFKNKGVQFMLDAGVFAISMDKEGIEGIHPDDAELLEEDQTKIFA
jgi:elongation factor G